jgi:hypothetical protein
MQILGIYALFTVSIYGLWVIRILCPRFQWVAWLQTYYEFMIDPWHTVHNMRHYFIAVPMANAENLILSE